MLLYALLATAHATTLPVGPAQPWATLQDALLDAHDGDLITIAPMTITGPVVIDGLDVTISALGAVVWEGQDTDLLTVRDADVAVLGVTFRPDGGRAVRVDSGSLALSNSELRGNNGARAPFDGAALALLGPGEVSLSHVVMRDNTARAGGGAFGLGGHLLVLGGTLTCDDCQLTQGAAVSGGALWIGEGGSATFTASTFTDNAASADGGAVRALGAGSLSFDGGSFTRNTAGVGGGALSVAGGPTPVAPAPLSLSHLQFDHNEATRDGGAVDFVVAQTLTIADVVWSSNTARHGGALHTSEGATVSVTRASFCANTANQKGGAAFFDTSAYVVLTNSVFTENTGRTGGAVTTAAGDVDIRQCTFAGDSANRGGALSLDGASLRFVNNLVTASPAGSGLDSSLATTVDYNAFFQNTPGDTTGAVALGPNTVTADPQLQAWSLDGQCGDDLRLRPLSPLVDAGDPAVFDPDGTRSDIGAFGGASAPAELFFDTDGDSALDAYDCATLDPLIHPGASERCDGVDNDCDGVIDGPNVAGAPTWYRDADRDGWGEEPPISDCLQPPRTATLSGDCDDRDGDIHPDAVEVCDGADNDCDGTTDLNAANMLSWYVDADADGYGDPGQSASACADPGGYSLSDADCDDADAARSPDAAEACDGVDQDCDGVTDDDPVDGLPWYPDADADGWGGSGAPITACSAPVGYGSSDADCDDSNPDQHPFAPESCVDPTDRNCDGSTGQQDQDGDGTVACEDCDDANPAAFPGAPDTPYDGVRTDCDRLSDFDADSDGYDAVAWGGADCDDANGAVHPEQADPAGDGVDQDCDGTTDEDPAPVNPSGCAGCAHGPRAPTVPGIALLTAALLRRRGREDSTKPSRASRTPGVH